MNENTKDFTQIPSGACTLVVGDFQLGDNGENSKSAPIKLVARSGGAIEHWFWGNVVHDMAGMYLHKSRLPIDYVHDAKEIIGYLNKFDTESGDLVTSGALTPFKGDDRATEILFKMGEGVPYEASINFGGDGIKVQELNQGQVEQVNGQEFEGPGIIVREWPLRGVAICPYGADANTESSALAGNNAKTYTASVLTSEPKTVAKETEMKKDQESVEVAAKVEKPEAVELEQEAVEEKPEAVEGEKVEVKAEGEKPVEAIAVEAEVKPEGEEVVEKADVEKAELSELSRDEFVKIADEFGDEVASCVMRDGGNYETALALAYKSAQVENAKLKEQLSQSNSNGRPVKVVDAPKDGKKPGLFSTGK